MRQYALHKKFIGDVDRHFRDSGNMEKVMLYAMQFLSLRLVHSDEISNEEIAYAVRKVNADNEFEIPDLYNILIQELTNQQYIFRIKRIKYLKDSRDSLMVVASPLMRELGKYLYEDTIRINMKEVTLLDKSEKNNSTDTVSLLRRIPDTLSRSYPRQSNADDPELKRIKEIWKDRNRRDEWILQNVLSTSKKYGYSNPGKYSASIVAKAVGVDPSTVLFYLRKKILSELY